MSFVHPVYTFQSTPSAWRETEWYHYSLYSSDISIHSLRMEGDLHRTSWKLLRRAFQSTPSAWRETVALYINDCPRLNFNPLPPHGGRQAPVRLLIRQGRYFNPLPPHGGRPDADRADHYIRADFNPLPPHGGRPPGYDRQDAACLISIHSLRMEGDPRRRQIWTDGRAFQSTPSAWRETLLALGYIPGVKHFNPLPPHGGRPAPVCQVV